MRENTIRILKHSDGVCHFFSISMAAVAGERAVHFAEQLEVHPHDRVPIVEAIEALLEHLPLEERDWTVIVTGVGVTLVDTTVDLIRAGTTVCLGELLFGARGAKIRHELRDGRWFVFVDERQLYPSMESGKDRAEDLNRAIQLYLGWKLIPFPHPDKSRVIEHFGHATGTELIADVLAITSDLAGIVPDEYTGHDLIKATDRATRQIARKYPQLDEDALAALAWYYSYEWK